MYQVGKIGDRDFSFYSEGEQFSLVLCTKAVENWI